MIVFSSELPADELGLSSFKERGNTSFAILVEFHDSAYVSFEGVEWTKSAASEMKWMNFLTVVQDNTHTHTHLHTDTHAGIWIDADL